MTDSELSAMETGGSSLVHESELVEAKLSLARLKTWELALRAYMSVLIVFFVGLGFLGLSWYVAVGGCALLCFQAERSRRKTRQGYSDCERVVLEQEALLAASLKVGEYEGTTPDQAN